MSNSHFPAETWCEIIKDTVQGNAIDYTAQKTGCSHQATFDMQHKVFMSLQQPPEINNICLGNVSEFDNTFVLDCYKGKKFDALSPELRVSMAQKQKKRGLSNEYICICAGIQCKGDTIVATVNRAKHSAEELLRIYDGHIADETPPSVTDYAVTMHFLG